VIRFRYAALPLTLLAGLAGGYALAQQNTPTASAEVLLTTDKTILGQPFAYPITDAPQVTAAIVTLPPGAETGWHHHDVPLFGYILEGELTVTYEAAGEKLYRSGDALMEALGTPHNGRNETSEPIRILAVFIGAEGVPNSVKAQ